MKDTLQFATILKNAISVSSQSEADWSYIRRGCLVRFGDDPTFYQVASVPERKMCIKDFRTFDGQILEIDDPTISFMTGDVITASFKEWTLGAAIRCITPGYCYSKNDILTPLIDGVRTDPSDGNVAKAEIIVNDIDQSGGIMSATVQYGGRYLVSSPSEFLVQSQSNGNGAKFAGTFSTIYERAICERDIFRVERTDKSLRLVLSHGLPTGVKEGKVSVTKWTFRIPVPYASESQFFVEMHVMRDFTEYCAFPLSAANSQVNGALFNELVRMVDARIFQIEKRFSV